MITKSSLYTFLDKPRNPDSQFILFGVPLDITTSNRSGTRFGPDAIRRESTFLETYSGRFELGWDDLDLSDIGDIEFKSLTECIYNIEKKFTKIEGFPIMLGGEHTVTFGAIKALSPELVVVFDAHLDVRDELFGHRLSHATYLRRAIEETGCKALVIGARALSEEEVLFTKKSKSVSYILSQKILRNIEDSISKISNIISSAKSIYISIDLDVLDPSFAPAVGNPHPEGISVSNLVDLVDVVMSGNVIGMDLTELYPHYDLGITATNAAYIILESLYSYTNHQVKDK